jgi:hypothetical protein
VIATELCRRPRFVRVCPVELFYEFRGMVKLIGGEPLVFFVRSFIA